MEKKQGIGDLLSSKLTNNEWIHIVEKGEIIE